MRWFQGKCRTCGKADYDVGWYCANCTLDHLVKRFGWGSHKWFTTTRTGVGTKWEQSRPDKADLLRQAIRAYAIAYGTEQARVAFMKEVKAILLKSPKYRSIGVSVWPDREVYRESDKPYERTLDFIVRSITTFVERRLRRSNGRQGPLESDDFGDDSYE